MSCPASALDQATPPMTPDIKATSIAELIPIIKAPAARPRWQNDFPVLFQRTIRAINRSKRPNSDYYCQESFMELTSMETVILRSSTLTKSLPPLNSPGQARYVYESDPSSSIVPTFEIISCLQRPVQRGEHEVDELERGLVSAMLVVFSTDVTQPQIVAESGSHENLRQAYEELLAQTQKFILGIVEFRPNTAVESTSSNTTVESPSGDSRRVSIVSMSSNCGLKVYRYRLPLLWVWGTWYVSVVCIIWFSFW